MSRMRGCHDCKKRNIVLVVGATILAALVIWTVWGNTALEQNIYTITSEKLPEAFDGYRFNNRPEVILIDLKTVGY